MPDLGRTTTQDPHAESYFSISPYSMMANNPIVNTDPTGMDVEYIYDDDGNVTGYRITGDDVYNYQSMLNTVSEGNASVDNMYAALDNAAGTNDGEGGAFANTIGEATVEGAMPMVLPIQASQQDFRGSNGALRYFFSGGNVDGYQYDFDGNIIGIAPITGTAPTPGKAKGVLPSLDRTGKVHGALPKIKDLSKFSKEELSILLKELKQSVQQRIRVTSKLGRDKAHGQRQGSEQDLIKAIEKYLKE